MPPRRRPPTDGARTVNRPADPGVHVPGFIQYLQAECGMAKNTVLAYRTDLEQFCEWSRLHGPEAIQQTTLAHLSGYLAYLHERQLAMTSIARKLVSVKMFFRYLVLEGVLKESVADLVNSPKLWQHLPKVLSPEVTDKLLTAPNIEDRCPLRDRALLALLYATGCRASEVCGLRLRDVNLEEGWCRCLGKGNKERIVSLNPVARTAVENYLARERPAAAGTDPDSPLLVTRRAQALDRILVWKLVKRYAARIGVSKNVSPHTLRHSFATHMLAGGAEIRALQELMGHASIRTTQVYTQVEHSRLKAIHERCHPRG
jgi:integrase/recombinase XerD